MLLSLFSSKDKKQEKTIISPFQKTKNIQVLKVSTVNFGFKSYNDRLAIIENFGRFLNSLTIPIQIICDTKLINPNEWLLKTEDKNYYEFLKELVQSKNVAEKLFYIVFSADNESELRVMTDNIKNSIKRCFLIAEEVELEDLKSIPKVKSSHVKVDNWYYHTLIVKNWPYSCKSGWLEELYNLDKNITLSMFIDPQDKQDAIKYISKKLARTQSNAIIKGIDNIYDGEEDEDIATALNMREELLKNEGKFFFVSYYITIKSRSLEELDRDVKFIKNFLNSMMIETKKANFRHDDGFRCTLPLAQNSLKSKADYTFTTTPLKRFFPFISSNVVDKDGIMIGSNLLNNSLIFLNHFNYQTASMIVLGKTGSGKSFTVKAQIDKLIKQNVEVTVLDVENEFSRMEKHQNLTIKHFGKTINDQYKRFLFDYWNKVDSDPTKPRFLVIEEFWLYMRDPEIAQLIQTMAKLGRKRWLGVCVVSQEVGDILKDDFSKSLINNSSIKILLQIEPNQRKVVQETFGLTDSECSFLISAPEGEGILFANTNHVQFKTLVSDKQYMQLTTKPQDLYVY